MRSVVLAACLAAVSAISLAAQNTQPSPDAMRSAPVAGLDAVKWGPAPAVFPAGAQLAVIAGDPSRDGEYTVRLRMPDGYAIAPHHHPTDENVTVLEGKLHVGMGDTVDRSKAAALSEGGFVSLPAQMNHYVWAEGETVVQVHGMGPFQLTYANPADDPSQKR